MSDLSPCEGPGCTALVDEADRDDTGLYCRPECAENAEQDRSERAEERRIRQGYEDGLDVRSTWPNDITFGRAS